LVADGTRFRGELDPSPPRRMVPCERSGSPRAAGRAANERASDPHRIRDSVPITPRSGVREVVHNGAFLEEFGIGAVSPSPGFVRARPIRRRCFGPGPPRHRALHGRIAWSPESAAPRTTASDALKRSASSEGVGGECSTHTKSSRACFEQRRERFPRSEAADAFFLPDDS